MEEADFIWMNGEIVPWADAKLHVLTHGLHYGTGVFEGIRAYDGELGTAVFRHREHLDRLHQSAGLYCMEIPYSVEELRTATHELIAKNGLRHCYIRPLATRGYGVMGLNPLDAPVDVIIAVWPWGAYLGEAGKQDGIRAQVSSWRRFGGDTLIPHAKASGQYLNSILAKIETVRAGYDEAIMLAQDGSVSEGSGENIFLVMGGRIIEPPQTASVLDGISRRTIHQLAADSGRTVESRSIARSELYIADEVFMTGTAAEVVPVREIDNRVIGSGQPGPVTRELQELYEDAVHGRIEARRDWLDPVEVPAADLAAES